VFGRKARIHKAVDRAIARLERADDLADHAPIEALPRDHRAQAYGWLAKVLFEGEWYQAARHSVASALALAPAEVELHQLAASIAIEIGDRDEAIAAQRRVVAMQPSHAPSAAALAEMLIDAERVAEAIELLRPLRTLRDPVLEMRLAEALFVTGEAAEALPILDQVCDHYDVQMKELAGAGWEALKERAGEASRLRDDVYAEMHGREATIELAARAGHLDAGAGVNYKLLGARLAATGERIADVLELETPEATERRGRALLHDHPDSAPGLVLVGCAELRLGEVAAARATFERACEADGRCFAAFIGLGAAMDHETLALHRRAARLALPKSLPAGLEEVVPDWPVLTDAERRVVWLSVQPFAGRLADLAERDVAIRILPIDVRATDVRLFEDAAGERAADDHRSYDALPGAATHGGAVAKIEELLDVGEHGLTFAHEFAHLVFFHLAEHEAEPLLHLYERAIELGYANTEYALSNPDEFFAVSYADYLRHRHELPGVPLEDDAGIQHDLRVYFDQLATA
jgi:tetratricopeptide (TPR) repeat protein